MQIMFTCLARAMYIPGQLFIQRRNFLAQLCHCAEFGTVAQHSKFTNSENPTFKKFSHSGLCCFCRSSPVTTMARANLWWPSCHKVSVVLVNWFGLHPSLNIFSKGLRDRTLHVPRQPIGPQTAPSGFRHSSA